MKQKYRSRILEWSYNHFTSEHRRQNANIYKIESFIHTLNIEQNKQHYKEKKSFTSFIKIIFSHEAIQYAKLNTIMRDPELTRLIPDVPKICNKQVAPAATMFCNYSQASCTIPQNDSGDPPPLPSPLDCPSQKRSMLKVT
jgi:hypothetical protein